MYYASRGSIPQQRHTQHRAPNGSLYAEELFGVEGFSGRSSLLYHLVSPTRTTRIEAGHRVELEAADDGLHRHRLINTAAVPPRGNVVSGRIPLFFNRDVVFGIVRPAEAMAESAAVAGSDWIQARKPKASASYPPAMAAAFVASRIDLRSCTDPPYRAADG